LVPIAGVCLGGTWSLLGASLRPHLRIRTEDRGEKAVFLEDRRRTVLLARILTHTIDPGSGFFDEGDAVEQVGNKGIAKKQLGAGSFGRFDVDQDVLSAGPAGDSLYSSVTPSPS
jgi:hypothetical protein